MRTWPKDGDRRGRRWFGGGSGLVLAGLAGLAVAALVVADTSCSLIVDTNSNQCTPATVTADCGGFPSLRTCTDNVCKVVTTAPACTADSDCSPYAKASCVAKACVRSCSANADCGAAGTCTAGSCGAPPTTGCQSDADCDGGTCSNGTCTTSCTVNADCMTMGTYFVCRKDTQTCVNLTSTECTDVYGKYQDDNAFIFGSVLPTGGPDMTTGQPLEQAIELAIDDFTNTSGGILPAIGSTANRPLVVVSCNDDSDTTTAEKATNHLVQDLGLQAIIGSAFSGITTDLATSITVPAKVLLFSPSATAATLSTLNDNGLFWRTAPSDDLQSTALNLWLPVVVQALSPQPSPLKVAVLHKDDTYGSGLATQLEAVLTINGALATDASNQAQFLSQGYGNPDDPQAMPTKYDQVIAATLQLLPHVIFLLGTNEAVHQVMEPIENQWPTSAGYRPQYIFSDGGELPDQATYVAGQDDGGVPMADIRTRITGTTPGSTGPVYTTFRQHFLDKYSGGAPDTFGAAGSYDIVYMLAYSAVGISSVTGQAALPLTAANLVTGFSRVVSATAAAPTAVNVGTMSIGSAQTVMTMPGANLALTGASGPLRYAITPGKTGEAQSDIQIWCLPPGKNPTSSNYYYDPTMPAALIDTPAGLGTQCTN